MTCAPVKPCKLTLDQNLEPVKPCKLVLDLELNPVKPCKLVLNLDEFDSDEDTLTTPRPAPSSLQQASTPKLVSKRQRGGLPAACSSPRKRRGRSVDRRVRFHEDVKLFDGLQPLSEALELTIWNFYTMQNIHSAEDILSFFRSCQRYNRVFKQVSAAINALANLLSNMSCDATVPVLRRGGGRGLLLSSAHVASFRKLRDMFESATKLISTRMDVEA